MKQSFPKYIKHTQRMVSLCAFCFGFEIAFHVSDEPFTCKAIEDYSELLIRQLPLSNVRTIGMSHHAHLPKVNK